MKNPLKTYIDKRIEETLRRNEREKEEEKQRIEKELVKRKKEEELHARAKQYVDKLISDGVCHVSIDGNDGWYGRNIPYDERPSSIVKKEIRITIMNSIVNSLFMEKTGHSLSNYTTFSLSEGLKQDLQKLHNIKPKENETV